ncbi:MAG: hypothetical protein JWM11_4566 [Planctomycetaceae bacterium]|nr:hypothetical protein [Planctomycetaceae bacterium]
MDDAIAGAGAENEVDEERLRLPAGLPFGYLLSRGDRALDRIDERILQDQTASSDNKFVAEYTLMLIWEQAQDRISPEQLRRSMRNLLNDSETAGVAINNLTEWRDWSIQDRLVEMYQQPGFNSAEIKQAILNYLTACSKQNDGATLPETTAISQARKAELSLDRFRQWNANLERFQQLHAKMMNVVEID